MPAAKDTYHAAIGDDLRQIQFDQQRMRGHIVQCFESESFLPFQSRKQTLLKLQNITFFCVCFVVCCLSVTMIWFVVVVVICGIIISVLV